MIMQKYIMLMKGNHYINLHARGVINWKYNYEIVACPYKEYD